MTKAVLTDYGGVLTTDIFASFRAWSARVVGDPLAVEQLLRGAPEVTAALVEHECGRLPQAGFEQVLAAALRARGPVRRILSDQPAVSGAVSCKAPDRPRTGPYSGDSATPQMAAPGAAGPKGFAGQALGADVEPEGLLRALSAGIGPDQAMQAAIRRLRAGGVPVALVSNALGDDLYDGVDLTALCDVAVISSEVGERKPSRRIYTIACERLGVAPEDCVLIDDLRHNLDGAARLGILGLHHVDSAATIRRLEQLFPQVFG